MENIKQQNAFERLSGNIQDLLDRNCTKGQFFDNILSIMADASEQDVKDIKEYLYPSDTLKESVDFTDIKYYRNWLLQN